MYIRPRDRNQGRVQSYSNSTTMEGPKTLLWMTSVFLGLALVANGKRSGDRDEDNAVLPSRPTRNKLNQGPDRKPELFNGLPDPDSSAQQVSPQISGFQGGGQNGLGGNQGLYTGLQNQGINPSLGGQGQLGFNPYLANSGGFGAGGFGGNSNLGFGFQQNPYAFLGGGQQDIYSQQGGVGGGGSGFGFAGGIYNPQQTGLGFGTGGGLGGIYNSNPYLTSGGNPYLTSTGNPYLTNPYLSQGNLGGGGLSSQFLNTNINPYLQRGNLGGGTGFYQTNNPYIGGISSLGGGGGGGGFINPYNNFNPYNSFNGFPLASRFGLGVGRGGSLGSRSNSGSSSSSSSSSDE